MIASPLPLSTRDIDGYLSSRPLLIDRDIIESAVFALDDAYREEWAREQRNGEEGDDEDD